MIPVRISLTEIAPAFAKRFKRSAGRTFRYRCTTPDQPLELCDKAMLEVLYASWPRLELVGLKLCDISLRQGVVRVIGKGNKDTGTVSEEAVYRLETHLEHGRPWLPNGVN